MTTRKISHARGRGSLNHNNRNHVYGNVDPSKTENNIYYAKESLDEAYHKCFGQALEVYNAKQKRAGRKIDDYYTHLFGNANKDTVATSSNKEKSFYEIVVGIGGMNDTAVGSAEGELAAKILDEYARGFAVRSPNFYVFNSVLHLDEKTPHLHIDYVPIAEGYKNGMAKRNSQSVALQQMGFGKNKNSINEWRKRERLILRELCQQYGLEVAEESKGRGHTLTPDEYKKMCDEVKDELRTDPDLVDELKGELRHDFITEHRQSLVQEAEEAAADEIGALNRKLAEETRPRLEGFIASEQRVNAMIDGMREETRGWGNNKKPHTVIEIPNTTNEQAITVLRTAQESAKNAANSKKFRASRDKAITEKNTAVEERDAAVKAKETANGEAQKYKQLYIKEQNYTSDLTSKLDHQRSEAKRWEGNYNNLYRQHVQLKRSKGLEI
ncbi:MAG: plasmid recombination protein [Defluviitaleaceae bacterium]|nr:plasmid recombination protein [Defluviitaleaceae bacterium]